MSTKCLICQSPIEPFISLGKMPIANGFLLPDQFAGEYFFELKAAFCPGCGMVQLAELVDRERMFHENYAFFSSTSTRHERSVLMTRSCAGLLRAVIKAVRIPISPLSFEF